MIPIGEPTTKIFRGKNVVYMLQQFNEYITQTVTLINETIYYDIRSGVLPDDTELVSQFDVEKEDMSLFTDNNGLEMHQRIIDRNNSEPVASNFYPMVYSSYVRNKNEQVSFICNRTLGVGMVTKGKVEIMIHRRTSFDDGRGVGESLQDLGIHSTRFKVILSNPVDSAFLRHHSIHEINFPLENFVVQSSQSLKPKYEPIKELPANIHLLSFDKKGDNELVRFVHLYEVDEHPVFSKKAIINFESIFNRFGSVKLDQLSLTSVNFISNQNPQRIEIDPIQILTFESKFQKLKEPKKEKDYRNNDFMNYDVLENIIQMK